MSRADLPPYEARKELIVIDRRGVYVAVGTMGGRFNGAPRYKVWRERTTPLSPIQPDAAQPVFAQNDTIDLLQVQLNEREPSGDIRSFRAWLVGRDDETEIVKLRDFTAILDGMRYEHAVVLSQRPSSRVGVDRAFEEVCRSFPAFDLVFAYDIAHDRYLIHVNGEQQPLVAVNRSDLMYLSGELEIARHIWVRVNEALSHPRNEQQQRQINTKPQQPVAEPEVIVSMMRQRHINLGD
jgi:hypothetical protein